VLIDIPKPVSQLTISVPNPCEVEVNPGEVLQTPKTTKALTLLDNLIKQDAHTHDEMSKQRRERHVQKLANAAQTCFAELALLQDQNDFLTEVNNEAKVRRSTKSLVLGTAKVMSYEDLEIARADRAAKDQAKAKRKRKLKSTPTEAVAPETAPETEPKAKEKRSRKRRRAPEPDAAQMNEVPDPASAPVAPINGTQVAQDEIAPELWRAPEARMSAQQDRIGPESWRDPVALMSGKQIAEDDVASKLWRAPVARMY
jgi:hypothetical protein